MLGFDFAFAGFTIFGLFAAIAVFAIECTMLACVFAVWKLSRIGSRYITGDDVYRALEWGYKPAGAIIVFEIILMFIGS